MQNVTSVVLITPDDRRRLLVTKYVESETSMKLVASVGTGVEGLRFVARNNVDVVIVDKTLPPLGQCETMVAINAVAKPKLIALCGRDEKFSEGSSQLTLFGADGVVLSPGEVVGDIDRFQRDLGATLRSFAKLPNDSTTITSNGIEPVSQVITTLSSGAPEIVVIAVSTGGPDALSRLLAKMPSNFPIPIVIVQHILKDFSSSLVQGLNRKTDLRVTEAHDGDIAISGNVLVVPADRHAILSRSGGRILVRLHDGPKENSVRPSADVLFRSAAKVSGPRTIAVVLTGMGEDGCKGAKELHNVGARVIAQDKDTSVVWGMPGAIVSAGIADSVLPLESIPGHLVALCHSTQRKLCC